MQQTETYKLNLMEGGDDFSPRPLNENAEAIEAALAAQGQAIAGNTQAVAQLQAGEETLTQTVQTLGSAVDTLAAVAALAGNCRIATGSYVGTGLGGAENPNSLTFDFEPKFMALFNNTGSMMGHINDNGSTCWYLGFTAPVGTTYGANGPWGTVKYSGYMAYKMSEDRKTIFWYHGNATKPQEPQANVSGVTYYYLALG